ncbi:MAG TPA: hypothetical protein VGK19_17870 [Capsulimonadaceae bacterium]|jgi:hypothetical protein
MSLFRDNLQPTLFAPYELAIIDRTWTVVAFALDSLRLVSPDFAKPVSAALVQALDNVAARRDPAMSRCSFDLASAARPDEYLLAIPNDIHPAVMGMITRKLVEVGGFRRMERKVAKLDTDFRPAGFYEAGAVWVLRTLALPSERLSDAEPVSLAPIRRRIGRDRGSIEQLNFTYG